VDEIVVVDAGSQDRTLEIAGRISAKIINSPWKGFPQQRNIGAQNASGEWLLYVDADERVSLPLKKEIRSLLKTGKARHSSYKIPRKNIIMGKWLRHGGWYPEQQHRLMRKEALQTWKGELHEHPVVKGSTGLLKGDLIHLTHRGIGWMLQKTIRYTRMEAKLRLKSQHPQVRVRHLFSAPMREFFFRGVKKSGWKDGLVGWIEIIYQAFNHFLIMVWLWEMQSKRSMEEIYRRIDRKYQNEL